MMGLGLQELLVIFGILMLLFGIRKLPEIGKGLGEGIRNFRWSLRQVQSLTDDEDVDKVRKGNEKEAERGKTVS